MIPGWGTKILHAKKKKKKKERKKKAPWEGFEQKVSLFKLQFKRVVQAVLKVSTAGADNPHYLLGLL